MTSLKKTGMYLQVAAVVLLCAACSKSVSQSPALPAVNQNSGSPYNIPLTVGSGKLSVQIVTSAADMQQGLSGRATMPEDDGMLFNFGTGANSKTAFWMKDMNFGLDFIWIKDGKVIGYTTNAPAQPGTPDSQLKLYYPPSPMDAALEVNAGWVKKNNITVGDAVKR